MSMADWSRLPADVLRTIAKKLHFVEDLLSFGLVCKSWGTVMRTSSSCSLLPWLMLTEKKERDKRRVYCPFNKKVYELFLPEIHGRRCWGSPHGWLVTLDAAYNMHLLDLLSHVQIRLPPLHRCSNLGSLVSGQAFRDIFVYKAVLSSDPSSADCVVLAIYSGKMAFAKPGDAAWTPLRCDTSLVNDVICFDGDFYAIDSSGDITICDSQGSHLKTISLPVEKVDDEIGVISLYLVDLGGKLHVVQRIMFDSKIYDDISVFRTWRFMIFRVDVCNGKWKEVNSLGDWSIFIGSNCSFSISASDYPECVKNCIYFTDDFSGLYYNSTTYRTYDMGTYELDGQRIQTFLPEAVSRFKYSLPVWIKPSVCITVFALNDFEIRPFVNEMTERNLSISHDCYCFVRGGGIWRLE